MYISADMKIAKGFVSTSKTSICGSRKKDSHPRVTLMHVHPRLAEYIYLRNITVKILPLQRLVDGAKVQKASFPSVYLTVSVTVFCLFFKLLMSLNNPHEDKFCSEETQIKQFTFLYTDS